MKDEAHPRWEKIRDSLRREGVADRPEGEDMSAPHGFAARVVARQFANQRADAEGVSLWRRWSLAGAAGALMLFGAGFLVKPQAPPREPFMPVPELDRIEHSQL